MSDIRSNEKFESKPVEQHQTAAWANIENTKSVTNVSIPNELEVDNAKEWVDSNQK